MCFILLLVAGAAIYMMNGFEQPKEEKEPVKPTADTEDVIDSPDQGEPKE